MLDKGGQAKGLTWKPHRWCSRYLWLRNFSNAEIIWESITSKPRLDTCKEGTCQKKSHKNMTIDMQGSKMKIPKVGKPASPLKRSAPTVASLDWFNGGKGWEFQIPKNSGLCWRLSTWRSQTTSSSLRISWRNDNVAQVSKLWEWPICNYNSDFRWVSIVKQTDGIGIITKLSEMAPLVRPKLPMVAKLPVLQPSLSYRIQHVTPLLEPKPT